MGKAKAKKGGGKNTSAMFKVAGSKTLKAKSSTKPVATNLKVLKEPLRSKSARKMMVQIAASKLQPTKESAGETQDFPISEDVPAGSAVVDRVVEDLAKM